MVVLTFPIGAYVTMSTGNEVKLHPGSKLSFKRADLILPASKCKKGKTLVELDDGRIETIVYDNNYLRHEV